jgi:hypothetical protein
MYSLGRTLGLTGALAVAAVARTRAAAERLVWGFDDGFAPVGCHGHRECCVCHHYRVECVPTQYGHCGPAEGHGHRGCCR